MPGHDINLFADEEMLDLFRMEVETHSAVLESGLVELEADPDSTGNIEPLMRAAHSIKGAARIVGLDAAVELAHAMEDRMVAAQEHESIIRSEEFDALLRAVDLFKNIGRTTPADLASWIEEHRAEMESAAVMISGLKDKPAVVPAQRSSAKVREMPPPSVPSPGMAEAENNFLQELPLLDLFREEVQMQAAILEDGLLDLEANHGAGGKIEPLMRAAHSIKGAARIVGLNDAVRLAHIMEDLLCAVLEGKKLLDERSVDALLRGGDLFKKLARVESYKMAEWLRGYLPELDEIEKAVTGAISGTPAVAAVPEQVRARVPGPVLEPPSLPSEVLELPPATKQQTGLQGPETVPVPAANVCAVAVTAENLSRLMGLSGECLVESRRLLSRVQDLHQIKSLLAQFPRLLEHLRETIPNSRNTEGSKKILTETLKHAGKCREALLRQIESFETYTLHWENLSNRLYNEALATKMRPFRDGVHGFPRMVRDMARKLGKKIKLKITGESTKVDREVLAKLEAPLTHILRNSCDHGIETPQVRLAAGKPEEGTIELRATQRAGMLVVTVSDDGRGLDMEMLRHKVVERAKVSETMALSLTEQELIDFLFLPGFSTAESVTEVSGRGVGLDVVKSMVQEVQGLVSAQSVLGRGISFTLELPLTLSTIRALVVEISGEPYAFPLTRLDRVLMVPRDRVEVIEGRQYFSYDGQNIGLVSACQPLQLEGVAQQGEELPMLVISDRLNRYGVVVERLLGEVELVVHPLDPRLGKVPNISAAAVKEDGSPILIIDVEDLVRSIDNMLTSGRVAAIQRSDACIDDKGVKRILVVDDSITVREVERRLLENKGYQVEVAVDGMDGWNALCGGKYHLLISDVDMPRMDGIELVRNVRKDPDMKDLPIVILSYKDREDDRKKGLDAGANYYLTKSSFYDESFLRAVVDLIGGARA